MRQYFDNNKDKMFPWVENWQDDFPEIKAKKSKDVPLKTWLFFHPTSYLIASYGTNVMTVLIFGGAGLWLYFKNNYILAFILGIIALSGAMALIKNIKNFQLIKNTTFYDLWLREY